ncbi:molybdate ABC transporter substrate-binding protein [Magnetovibrio sp. PR-2]|uniref:molybdate ABC transporter substrate-binding protein n=1 Tax=Magnetovibrio sp. PR-2 TaxID=3120356 RepID=UPI002FCE5CA5
MPTIMCPKTLLSAMAFFICSLLVSRVQADVVSVAVAANFTAPAKEIAEAFAQETGHRAVLSFGSTGKLYAQIAHGAPFQVFLSADRDRAQLVIDKNLAIDGTRMTYAVGHIVLYSSDPHLVDASGRVLHSDRYVKLAIANPNTAPYGRAAMEAVKNLGLYERVRNRFVQGESVSQAHQFVATGNAQLGFIAHSLVQKSAHGSIWKVPKELYSPIEQDAVLLSSGLNHKAATAFLEFLGSVQVKEIVAKFGYDLGLPH